MENTVQPRKILDQLKPYQESKEIIVITGFRRVGKTTVIKSIYSSLPSANKLYLDLETPINQRIFEEENYDNVILTLRAKGLNFEKKAFLFLDEIQYVKNLPSIVKYLYDHYNIKFYLTGSSSFYLKNYFSESLAGRKYVFNLHPLDFEEFLRFKNISYNLADFAKASANVYYETLSKFYHEYLEFGGFPQVVLAKNSEEKRLKLNDIIGSYFKLDVQFLAHFKDNENLKKLLFLLPSRVGSKLDIGKLSQTLGVRSTTAQSYLDFFEQTFLIDRIKPFSRARDIEIRKKPKLYLIDTGIAGAFGPIAPASLFENKVLNQLITRSSYIDKDQLLTDPINYFATKYGQEIDFIYHKQIALEVKQRATIHDVDNLKRRAGKLGITSYKVISLEKTEQDLHILYPFFLNSKVDL